MLKQLKNITAVVLVNAMKKNPINGMFHVGIVLLFFFSGCAPSQSDHFTIKGNIKGLDTGTVILRRFNEQDRTTKNIDSIVFKNGTFELKGKTDHPEMMSVLIKTGNWTMDLFVEDGVIHLDADTAGAEHFDYTEYGGSKGAVLKTLKITGSKSQQEYESFENDPEKVQFKSAFLAMNKRIEGEKDPQKVAGLKAEFEALGKKSNSWELKWIDTFVTKNPTSSVAAFLFYNYYKMHSDMSLTDLEALLNKFTGAGRGSLYYLNLSKELNSRKAVSPGQQAPEFELLKADSSTFKLSSLKGQYVMLDFWASWCKPCRAGIPEWKKVYEMYHPKGFEIVSITNDTRRSDWTKALDQEKMAWIQVADEFPVANMTGKVITQYQAPFLPFYILIDKEGKIILRAEEEKAIVEKLKELLK